MVELGRNMAREELGKWRSENKDDGAGAGQKKALAINDSPSEG